MSLSICDVKDVQIYCIYANKLFFVRHSDSNEHIRAMCMESLSRMTLQRPDMFLTDKYLKYFGWMMHDKDHHVRVAALNGLLQPFKKVQDAQEGKELAPADEFLMIDKIDLSLLENVIGKFLSRITLSIKDPKPEVQEIAMKVLLMLLKNGFLDDCEDDEVWDTINQRALSERAVSTHIIVLSFGEFCLLIIY